MGWDGIFGECGLVVFSAGKEKYGSELIKDSKVGCWGVDGGLGYRAVRERGGRGRNDMISTYRALMKRSRSSIPPEMPKRIHHALPTCFTT